MLRREESHATYCRVTVTPYVSFAFQSFTSGQARPFTCDLSVAWGERFYSMWSHPSHDSSRWVVNARAGAGTGGQARDGVHWSTRSGPSSWRPYQTASTPHAHTFTIRSFAQTATNFPGDASLASRSATKPAKESINWQRQRHQVGSPTFSGLPRGPALQAAREQLAESVSAASLETSFARRPFPIEALASNIPVRVADTFSTGNLRRPLTNDGVRTAASLHGQSGPSFSSTSFGSATSSLAGPGGAPCGMGPKGAAADSISPRPPSSGGSRGGIITVTRSLNNLSEARATPGPTAWGKHSKSVSARKVTQHSPSMELLPTRSNMYWIAQRNQLTERTRINERELTKDTPLLRGAHASGRTSQGVGRPKSVEPTGINEKMPIPLAKSTAAPGASLPPSTLNASDALSAAASVTTPVTPHSQLERRRAGWNERFVHGSPVLDGSRRWPDAGRVFVR